MKIILLLASFLIISIVLQPVFAVDKNTTASMNAKAINQRVMGNVTNTPIMKPIEKPIKTEYIPDDSTIKKLEIKNKRMELKELLKSYKKQDIDRTEFLQRYAVLRAQINSLNQ